MSRSTNANSALIAAMLASGKVGTFTGLVTTKRGAERGPKGNKVTYGNDTVHVCLFTGFKYAGLVERSLEALAEIDDADVLADALEDGVKAWSGRGKKAVQIDLTLADIQAARAEMVASFESTLAGTNESSNDHVFEPLVVKGKPVRGGRVYQCVADDPAHECKCRDCTGDRKAPRPGTINVQGLKVSSRVITPAPNGPLPPSKSAPKSVAKRLLRSRLPISRYVSYRLEPGTDFLLRVGGTAQVAAEKDGIVFTNDMRDAIRNSQAA